jgi:RNA polymerase sigma-70 factor (ECF subfamily)
VVSCDQDKAVLAAHAMGALDEAEALSVGRHVASCERCQVELGELDEVRTALDSLPPEAWLDGPPEGADLLLQRTLRAARAERAGRLFSRRLATAAAAAVLAVVGVGGGVLVGRGTAPQNAGQPLGSSAVTTPPPGTRTLSATDAGTGARLTVRVEPAAGWVRVSAAVTGIPAGQRCRLRVVDKDGRGVDAGSWLVSEKGAREGTTLNGSALVAPADVASVRVENFDGRPFVSVSV